MTVSLTSQAVGEETIVAASVGSVWRSLQSIVAPENRYSRYVLVDTVVLARQLNDIAVQFGMPIPVHDREGGIMQSCGDLAAAQAALEARQLAIQERLTIAIRDYTTARERVAKYNEKILPAAKETLDLITAGYQQGQLEYVHVYNVQQTYANKNLSYLQDLATAWQRWAEIDGFLVGDISADSIDRTAQNPENTFDRRY